jgi:hypothetical protein
MKGESKFFVSTKSEIFYVIVFYYEKILLLHLEMLKFLENNVMIDLIKRWNRIESGNGFRDFPKNKLRKIIDAHLFIVKKKYNFSCKN